MKCQNPESERDHNKPIINRKWRHYGLKVSRERSLVTAFSQIHTFHQGLGGAGSPPNRVLRGFRDNWGHLGCTLQALPSPGAPLNPKSINFSVLKKDCQTFGWPDNLKTLDSI